MPPVAPTVLLMVKAFTAAVRAMVLVSALIACATVMPPLLFVMLMAPSTVLMPSKPLTLPIVKSAGLPGLFVKLNALVLPVKFAAMVPIVLF